MSKNFIRHCSHKIKRLSSRWRRQRGLHNKVRRELKGYVRKVKIGHGSPKKKVLPLLIDNEKALRKLPQSKMPLCFSSGLGKKKKMLLLALAHQLGFTVVNVKKDYITRIETEMQQRKKRKQSLTQKKIEVTPTIPKQKEKEQTEKQEITDKERKEVEKKEKDAVLTSKGGMQP